MISELVRGPSHSFGMTRVNATVIDRRYSESQAMRLPYNFRDPSTALGMI